MAEHSCPASDLQREYPHLQGLPLPDVVHTRPLILIGLDHCHLLVPKEPVRIGPYGGPIAVHTALGWAVQGPANALPQPLTSGVQALFTLCKTVFCPATAELMENVERLDSFPHHKEKEVTRSKQDHYCLELLKAKTAADRGTNFRAGDKELNQCFQAMEPKLQEHLADQQIAFNSIRQVQSELNDWFMTVLRRPQIKD